MTPMEMKAQAVNTEMPNGKRLADCTHEEIMTFGELCIELASPKRQGVTPMKPRWRITINLFGSSTTTR